MFFRLLGCFILLSFFVINSCRTNVEKNKELLFWCSNNDKEIKFSVSITNKWNKAHPENPIHLQPIPEGQSSEEVILAAVVGNTAPDIYANMWQGNVEMYARAGVLVPLDTLKGFLQFISERCDSAVIKEITSADGHIYQVPWKVNPIMTIYNKSLFKTNNINELPKTYSAYQKAAELFKNNNKNSGRQKRFGYTAVKVIWYERLFNFYPLYLAASGGAPLIVNNKAAFNNKYAIQVFRFLQSLYINEYFSRENTAASTDPFVAQTIATKWTGPWEIQYLNKIPDRNFDFDYYEQVVPDDHVGPVYTYADPKNIVMFNTCTNPQVAWNFLQTLISKEGDLELLEVSAQLPRRKELDKDEFYKNYFLQNPMMMRFANQLPFIKGIDNCEVIVEVLDIISQEYEACVVYGKKTPEKAIADAEEAVNVLLGKNK
ncbi:MAG TPA: extracellular solute-binding protein [Chitinophagaceae bacterium]|nr:extracellular solute-binding protein [Chitinophagaceae bacterium]